MTCIYIMVMYSQQAEVVMEVLIRLHNEAKLYDKLSDDYFKRASAISYILNKVKADFDVETMISIFANTSEKLGGTLKPINHTILKELVKAGFVVTKVEHVISYEK